MRKYLTALSMITCLSAFPQRYDIYVGVNPVYSVNYNDQFYINDSINSQKQKQNQTYMQYYAKFGYVFDHDVELRVGYKFGYATGSYNYQAPSFNETQSESYKATLHTIDISGLKIIRYKFINFIVGGTFNFTCIPAYTEPGSFIDASNSTAYTNEQFAYRYPAEYQWGFYINTSLYFRIYKFLYAGMDINDGFYIDRLSGNGTYTSRSYASNGALISTNTETNHYDDLIVEKSVLNMDIGFRFFFDTKKGRQKDKDKGIDF